MATNVNEKSRFQLIPIPSEAAEMTFTSDLAQCAYVDMSLIHNVFIRTMNSIYYYATRVKKEDEPSFVGYILVFTEGIHLHHHGEEEIIFPFLQSKNDMTQNVEQHDVFKKEMEDFEAYVKDISDGKAEYQGEKIRELLERFGDTLVEHLHEEIPTLSPERMAVYDEAELLGLAKAMETHIKTFPLTRSHPLVITHHDFKEVPAWPPIPVPVKWVVRNVLFWRHSSYWKFAPFTRTGEPQEYIGTTVV